MYDISIFLYNKSFIQKIFAIKLIIDAVINGESHVNVRFCLSMLPKFQHLFSVLN